MIDADGATLSWDEVESRVAVFAAVLRDAGVVRGDRVAVMLPNGLDWPVAFWGALRANATVVPVNPAYTPRERDHILDDADVKVVVSATDAGRRTIDPSATAHGPSERVDCATEEPDELAALCYTSGTTGRPKGAILTHRNLLTNIDGFGDLPLLRLTADDVLLGVLPFFHVFGLNVVLNAAAWARASVLALPSFSPAGCLAAMAQHGVSVVYGAPPLLAALAAVPDPPPLPRLRAAVSGADSLPVSVWERFRERFGIDIVEGYGLTEAAPVVASTAASAQVRPGTVGAPLPNVEIELRDPAGQVVAANEVGEICVRGPNVFGGYHGAAAASAEVLRDGWLLTGDLGELDDDGYLRIVGRLKDLIIVSGFNVYPREVEDAIAEHPDVAEVAVIGVPDRRTGERVRAVVAARHGATLTADEITRHAKTRLARYKVPRDIDIVPALPRLPTGKLARSALQP